MSTALGKSSSAPALGSYTKAMRQPSQGSGSPKPNARSAGEGRVAAHRTSCSPEPHGARELPDITAETWPLHAFFWEKDTSHPSHGLPRVLEESLSAHVSHHHTTSEPHWAPQSLAHPSSPPLGAYEWRTGRPVLGQEGQVKRSVPDLEMTAGTTLQKMKMRLWEGTTQDRLGVTGVVAGAPGSGKASQEQQQLSWP